MDIGQRFRDRGFKNGLVDELKVFQRCITPIEVAQLYDGHSFRCCWPSRPTHSMHAARAVVRLLPAQSRSDYGPASRIADGTSATTQRKAIDSVPEIMVMRELPEPRPTFLLTTRCLRCAGPPGAARYARLPAAVALEQPKNRLGLARWLTDPQHPLFARVTVNRFWQAVMGRGLVRTAEDLGSQGAAPTHPELLDWLARHFIDSSWDVKELIKLIVTSSTYRQDSHCSPSSAHA